MTTINKIRDEIFDSKKKLNYMDAKKFILDYLTEGIYTGSCVKLYHGNHIKNNQNIPEYIGYNIFILSK